MSAFKTLVKTTLTPIALCLTLAIATPAMAQKSHHQQHDGMRQILSELSLTDTQKQDIKQILKQNREDKGLFRIDAKSLQTELRSLVQSTEWDPAAVESAFTQRQALIQEKALQQATNKNLVLNVLTDPQQAEFIALLFARKTEFNTRKAGREETSTKAKRKGKRKHNMLKRLGLTEEQLAAVQMIKTAAKASVEETQAKLKTYKQAERALIHSTDFNTEAWQTLSNEYQSDFLAMAVLKVKTKHDIWNLLTPVQQAEAEEKFKSKKGKHGKKDKNGKKGKKGKKRQQR
jgi:protein CpxP